MSNRENDYSNSSVKNAAIECLKTYRPVLNAEKSTSEELIALEKLIETMKQNGKTQEFDYLSPSQCELLTLDQFRERRSALKARHLCLMAKRRAIERSLEALQSDQQKILKELFISRPEKAKTVFDLMDALGIEKTQLYRTRSKALCDFAQNMFGT